MESRGLFPAEMPTGHTDGASVGGGEGIDG
jgi:hypothetical protein